ncbi:MAG TPA: hypothetical protein VF221_21905, partial [Chloroflexota bacterium]
ATLNQLRSRFDFESWPRRTTLAENLFIWRLYLTGTELPGWQAYRIQTVTVERWPPSIESIWIPDSGDTDTLLSVDVFQCSSLSAAKDFLLRMLGDFQSPQITRRADDTPGDVAFSGPGDSHIIFARANLVIAIRNAGPAVVPVIPAARQLDALFSARPEPTSGAVAPSITRLEARAVPAGQLAPLEIQASDPLGRPLWFKFFSQSGEVFAQDDELLYRSGAGEQMITAYAVSPTGEVARAELRPGGESQTPPESAG